MVAVWELANRDRCVRGATSIFCPPFASKAKWLLFSKDQQFASGFSMVFLVDFTDYH